jgi:FkbM family methyltransferase
VTFLTKIFDLITFKLPFYGIKAVVKLGGRKRDEVWNKLPFRNFKTPKILPDGNTIIVPWEDHYVDYDIYCKATYNRFCTPKPGNVVVDAGAHIGVYALKTAKEVGESGQVIAIEPEKENFKLLSKNIRINKHQNITPIKIALSDFQGKANFFIKARSRSHSLVGKTWITPIVDMTETAVTTLDELLNKLGVMKVDLLKLNVEGAEMEVLKGSRELLANGRISRIVTTPHPPYNKEAGKISRYLKGFGYEIELVEGEHILYAYLA